MTKQKKLVVAIALFLPVLSSASQSADNLQVDDFMSAKIGTKANVKIVLEGLDLAVAVEPVPIPGADHPQWWVIEGQGVLMEKGGEVFARTGEIVVCSERMGDCTTRFRVKIETEINLTSVAAQMKDLRFEGQMLQLADLARRKPEISVANEAGRIILRAQ